MYKDSTYVTLSIIYFVCITMAVRSAEFENQFPPPLEQIASLEIETNFTPEGSIKSLHDVEEDSVSAQVIQVIDEEESTNEQVVQATITRVQNPYAQFERRTKILGGILALVNIGAGITEICSSIASPADQSIGTMFYEKTGVEIFKPLVACAAATGIVGFWNGFKVRYWQRQSNVPRRERAETQALGFMGLAAGATFSAIASIYAGSSSEYDVHFVAPLLSSFGAAVMIGSGIAETYRISRQKQQQTQ